MNVIEEVTTIVTLLNELDNYSSSLVNKISELDLRQQDLLHYIENNSLKTNECYRIIRELKKIRESRRKVKNDMDLLSKYNEQKTKLVSTDNRRFLLAEMHKREKILGKSYTNKGYTDEELEAILKGVWLCISN